MKHTTTEHESSPVVCGDCIGVMREMKEDSVGLIIFSPPYNVRMNYDACKDEWDWSYYYSWMERVIPECYRLVEIGGTVCIIAPPVIRWQAEHEVSDTWFGYDGEYKTHRNGE